MTPPPSQRLPPRNHIIAPNTFISSTTPSPSKPQNPAERDRYLIFFIPGNPGLISYYTDFLSGLTSHLSPIKDVSSHGGTKPTEEEREDSDYEPVNTDGPDGNLDIKIYGCSLGGFAVPPYEDESTRGEEGKKPLGLKGQIEFVETRLGGFVGAEVVGEELGVGLTWDGEPGAVYEDGDDAQQEEGEMRYKVILVSHSVGAYIALEVLRRHQERMRRANEEMGDKDRPSARFDVVGEVLLFPTVVDIAKSPSGRKLGWLLRLPHFAVLVQFLVRFITWLLPVQLLRFVVKLTMGLPPDNAVDTTLNFLGSKGGVEQGLHMAKDEMAEITLDRWEEDIWGSTEKAPKTKLYFLFGKRDHWVADKTREELIAARGGQEAWRPKMVVEADNVPHGFCIRHGEAVAKKAAQYIREIVEGNDDKLG